MVRTNTLSLALLGRWLILAAPDEFRNRSQFSNKTRIYCHACSSETSTRPHGIQTTGLDQYKHFVSPSALPPYSYLYYNCICLQQDHTMSYTHLNTITTLCGASNGRVRGGDKHACIQNKSLMWPSTSASCISAPINFSMKKHSMSLQSLRAAGAQSGTAKHKMYVC